MGLILIVLFTDETYYNRASPLEHQDARKSRWARLLGIERLPRSTLLDSVSRPVVAISKIPVLLVVMYYFLNFAWIIGVNATISTWLTEFYGFNPKELGKLIYHHRVYLLLTIP